MKRKSVSSTTMNSVGYDSGKKLLEMQFSSGDVYQYFNVPYEVYERLMNAPSHGQYFNIHIKDAGFHFEKSTE
jgi:hypothetical protein